MSFILPDTCHRLLDGARTAGHALLSEPEALELVRALGIGVARHAVVRTAEEARRLDLDAFPGSRLVVKVVSHEILHKSDVGGVVVVAKEGEALAVAVAALAERFPPPFLVAEWVEHETALGAELLLGVRFTEDFGPVVVLGPGGLDAEHLATSLAPGRGAAILSPALSGAHHRGAALRAKAFEPLVVEARRGRPPRLDRRHLDALLDTVLAFAEACVPGAVAELEINPLALTERGPVALDAVVRPGSGEPSVDAPPRPTAKLARLLAPRSVAVAGVSRRQNPGRIIVENLLGEGFPAEHLHVVKPGGEEDRILGCPVAPSFSELPERVDLAVLAVDAEGSVEILGELLDGDLADGVVLIPGGFGERAGSEGRVEALRQKLAASRRRPGGGPLVNGGNCLGVRSVPGRLDTMFIPRHKLRYHDVPPAPLAVISQSGAFAVARASGLEALNPRYLISVGNQLDLTVGDYLAHLKDDPEVETFACYVEGFRPGDGRRFLEAAASIVASGRTVLVYRAGRTAAGARASASHTASVAGEYAVARELLETAGAIICSHLEEFSDLVQLAGRLAGRKMGGRRLGALSNAGFECVAIADSLGDLELARFAPETAARLEELLASRRLEEIVGVHNPLDVTPIFDDEAFAAAARAVLEDPGVDVGLVACVPLTGALKTADGEDIDTDDAIAARLIELWRTVEKPWVVVVDGGRRYDAFRRRLEAAGLPVFLSVDRAVRRLDRLAGARFS